MQSNQIKSDMKCVEESDVTMRVRSWGALVDNSDFVWLPVLNTNCLIKSDEHGKYEYIGELLVDHEKNNNCILKVLEYDNRIFFFLKAEYDVCILDKHSLTMKRVSYGIGNNKGIADVVKADKYAVVLTSSVKKPAIVFDMEKLESELLDTKDSPQYDDSSFIRGIYFDNSVYTATRHLNSEYICRIGLHDKQVEYYSIDVKMVNAICSDGNNLWILALTNNNKTVIRKYQKSLTGFVKEYLLQDVEPVLESGIMYYFRMECFEDRLFLIPSIAKQIYVYDTIKETGHFLDYPDEIDKRDTGTTFVEEQRKESLLYLFPYGLRQLLRVNLHNEEMDCISIETDTESKIKMIDRFVKGSIGIIQEGFPITLNDFLRAI